jgi:hypothetical protein
VFAWKAAQFRSPSDSAGRVKDQFLFRVRIEVRAICIIRKAGYENVVEVMDIRSFDEFPDPSQALLGGVPICTSLKQGMEQESDWNIIRSDHDIIDEGAGIPS